MSNVDRVAPAGTAHAHDGDHAARRSRARYRDFWSDVGASFPVIKGAASTAYYFDCERLLYETFFPELRERTLLKTDLWNEAKNTEILNWAASRGARPVGIDISFDVVSDGRRILLDHRPGCAVSDVRALPFAADSFDLVYSMGTIEHFAECGVAVGEMFRVLRPGGHAIIGVPNRLDPFLRPALVYVMQRLGVYAYGVERSFTPRALRRLLESEGFRVTAQTGILFMPGWLRMLDLLCYTRAPTLARVTAALVRPFAWLYRRVPAVRRHGYLTACVVEKPRADRP